MSRCEHGVHGNERCYQCWPVGLEDIDERIAPLNERIAQLEEQYRKLYKEHQGLLRRLRG